MEPQSKPSAKGIYRIRLLEHSPDLYMELVPGGNPSVKLNPLNASDTKQQWVITPIDNDQYHIHSVFDNSGLVKSAERGLDGYGYPVPEASGKSATWVLTEGSFHIHKFSKITLLHESEELDCSHDKVSEKVVRFNKPDHDSVHQRWVFERVDIYNPPGPTAADRDLQRSFFQLTVDQAKLNEYDIIVIGTGIGGGIIASDLFETNSMLGKDAKSVLVIERGNLAFHSHCLNTARPSGLNEDRGQQNDTFFAKFRENFNFSEEMNVDDWKGGPMYCLGGRSAAWGLFAPRVHDEILSRHFHPRVRHDLVSKYFREAETLMSLSLPTTKPIHQDLMERLNMAGDLGVQWQWGRIASEFRDDKNFDFASGAYSTIDKLLEIAMSKPKAPDGSDIEHANFKILLETEARALEFDDERKATGVVVRTPDGREETISLKANGRVVLAAGSVASPAILLRSGVNLKKHGGLHLTDHDIFFKAQPFRYRIPQARQEVGTMKLQTYMRLEREGAEDEVVLSNMSIDASSFLPRGNLLQYNDFPKWIIAFIRPAPLNPKNMVEMVDDEPVVTINRERPFNNDDPDMKSLRKATDKVMATLQEVLNIEFLKDHTNTDPRYFQPLELGGVAHELGTIPMRGKSGGPSTYCLDEDLKLVGHDGVYVCDLSVFPMSPEVNPTLTLAALALRLSREVLAPRLSLTTPDGDIISTQNGRIDPNTVYVVNHSGMKIRVFVGNRSDVYSTTDGDTELEPGEWTTRTRCAGTAEAVSVFRLAFNSLDEFLAEPELRVAHPGTILPIH